MSAWTAMSLRALTDGRALTNAGDDLGQITVWGQVNGDRAVLDGPLDRTNVWDLRFRTILDAKTDVYDVFERRFRRFGR